MKGEIFGNKIPEYFSNVFSSNFDKTQIMRKCVFKNGTPTQIGRRANPTNKPPTTKTKYRAAMGIEIIE